MTLALFAAGFLPHRRFPKWLEDDVADSVLAYAVQNQDRFTPSQVRMNGGGGVNLERRRSMRLDDLGPFADMLRQRALEAAPKLSSQFGGGNLIPRHVELELVAHGDGAFFSRHKDTFTGVDRPPLSRRVTMVSYLYRRPKAFSGGQLRTYSLSGGNYFDIEPEHGLMAAFPSWAPHSVERVCCPSNKFADYRFAIDIWVQG